MVFFPQYRTCIPSEYLAVTGWGIDGTLVTKKKWLFPGQQYRMIDVSPENYEFDIQAMSSEMLPFALPAVFTIGPKLEIADLTLYASLLATHALNTKHVEDIIKGIVEGETRVLAASMTMRNIFENTKDFKQGVYDQVQQELNQFGLKIYNANIKQLKDLPGHEYFSYLGQKVQKNAANQAKIDIAQADYVGNVGAKEREGETTRNVCKIQNETDLFQIEQQQIISMKRADTQADIEINQNKAVAHVAIERALLDQKTKIANIEADKMAEIREADLENELNQKRAIATTERCRAEKYSVAVVENEIVAKEADAEYYRRQREADANLYTKQKQAEAMILTAQAQSTAVSHMVKAFSGDIQSYLYWKMLDEKLYEKLAEKNAEAIKGLCPNISMWNTGEQSGSAKGLTEFFQSIPPIFSTIEQQTGVSMLPNLVMNNGNNKETKNNNDKGKFRTGNGPVLVDINPALSTK